MNYNKLKEIINRHDPVGLLELDAPQNEYDPEIGTLLPRIKKATTEDEIAKIVVEEFTKWFGKEIFKGKEDVVTNIAKDIYQTIK